MKKFLLLNLDKKFNECSKKFWKKKSKKYMQSKIEQTVGNKTDPNDFTKLFKEDAILTKNIEKEKIEKNKELEEKLLKAKEEKREFLRRKIDRNDNEKNVEKKIAQKKKKKKAKSSEEVIAQNDFDISIKAQGFSEVKSPDIKENVNPNNNNNIPDFSKISKISGNDQEGNTHFSSANF